MPDQVAEGRHVMDGPDVWDRYIAARLEEAASIREEQNRRRQIVSAGAPAPTNEREKKASVASQGGAGG